jgi:membrane protein implicated in regulation of membrane protease activity
MPWELQNRAPVEHIAGATTADARRPSTKKSGMIILFLASFVAGLLLAVGVMMYGVERPRDDNPAGERSFRLSPAIMVAFLTTFGATGYVLTRRSFGTVAMILGIAAGLGVVLSLIAAHFVKRWWGITPEHDVDDIRYILQGHIARVTKPIRADVDGEVEYELESARHVLRARSFDDGAIAAGTEVVIERIEDGVAYVEAWMEVEKRL